MKNILSYDRRLLSIAVLAAINMVVILLLTYFLGFEPAIIGVLSVTIADQSLMRREK